MALHHHGDGVTSDAHELPLLLVVRIPQCSDYSQFEALARVSKFGVTSSTSSAEFAPLDGTFFTSFNLTLLAALFQSCVLSPPGSNQRPIVTPLKI
jgi:hypothetical protein